MPSPIGRTYMLVLTEDYAKSLDELRRQLMEAEEQLEHWGIIHHDLDQGSNHYHIALKYKAPVRLSAVAKQMNQPENLIQLWRKNEGNMWGYMTHQTKNAKANKADYLPYLDDPTKSLWDSEETKDLARYKPEKQASANKQKLDKLINEILLGKTTQKDLLKPENIVYYHENYQKINRAIQLRTQSLRYNPPLCKTVYVQGKSGTGKTNFAVKMAGQKYPDSWAFASAGNDPLQDYTGEKCLIFDDWRPQQYELADLLAMLDPTHRTRTHKSRYYNKPLATELIILTSNMPLEKAVEYYTDYNEEDPKQIRRRIHRVVTIDENQRPTNEFYNHQLDIYGPKDQ
jgi:RNA helicase-like protein